MAVSIRVCRFVETRTSRSRVSSLSDLETMDECFGRATDRARTFRALSIVSSPRRRLAPTCLEIQATGNYSPPPALGDCQPGTQVVDRFVSDAELRRGLQLAAAKHALLRARVVGSGAAARGPASRRQSDSRLYSYLRCVSSPLFRVRWRGSNALEHVSPFGFPAHSPYVPSRASTRVSPHSASKTAAEFQIDSVRPGAVRPALRSRTGAR